MRSTVTTSCGNLSGVDLEKSTIIAALKRADGNIEEAARDLGCSRRTLQNRMRSHGLPRGRSGRRKRELPYGRKSSSGIVAGLGAAALAGVGYLALRRRPV